MPETRNPQVSILLGVVFLVYLGHMTLFPIIAPLSREVGLQEWQIGAAGSTAGAMILLSSQFWGRRGQSWGRRR
ncbi:MAG: MFS transporter, partial [Actinomycetales bacterium]